MIYLPILGAMLFGLIMITEKKVVSNKNIDVWLYVVIKFLFVVLVSLPFLYFFWNIQPEALNLVNIFVFLLIVFLSLLANYFVVYSFKGDSVNHLEPARALEPLFVIFFALILSFFFGTELYDRNAGIFIPALIAGVALIFSHIHKGHLEFNKYFLASVLASLFFALEMSISRILLEFYSPISFYVVRCFAVSVFAFVIFRPKFSKLDNKSSGLFFIIGALLLGFRVIIYYGYVQLGVIFTTLLIMLGPVFVYIFAHFVLKERMSWKNFIASLVIVGSVGYVLFN